MKKSLFMLALGLTVATSMVAGTMAIYTHTDELLASNGDNGVDGIAKKFYVNAATTGEVKDFKLAPGEHYNWNFAVTNKDGNVVSEVDTDLLVKVDLGTISNWQDFSVVMKQGNEVITGTKNADGTVSFAKANAFLANTENTIDYSLEFKWLDGEGTLSDTDDTKLVLGENGPKANAELPQVTNIKVTVTGSQHQ